MTSENPNKKDQPEKQTKVELADKLLIRPNLFYIKTRDLEDLSERREIFRYGDSTLICYGPRLIERDRGTMIAILDLWERNGKEEFDYRLPDIAKAQGIKNPYEETSLRPIRESIEVLLEAQIRIVHDKNTKGLTARFVFLEGYLDSDDTGRLAPGQYIKTIQKLALGCTLIQPARYFSINSKIARSLHCFLESQQDYYTGVGYKIGLIKLCGHLNYQIDGRPNWEIWSHIKAAIEELKSQGLIGRYTRRKKDGLLTFWPPAKKEKVLPEASIGSSPKRILHDHFKENAKSYIENCLQPLLEKNENKTEGAAFAKGIIHLNEWYLKSQKRPDYNQDNTPKPESPLYYTYTTWQNLIPSSLRLLKEYVAWLLEQKWLTRLTADVFKHESKVFQQYFKWTQDENGVDFLTGRRLN